MIKSKDKLTTEKYPLPKTVDGILSLVREILSGGKVQRVEIDMNLPIRVNRLVTNDGDPDLKEPSVELDGVLRNVEMVEYASPGATPFQVVVDMFHLANSENLTGACWVVSTSSKDLLSEWLAYKSRGLPSSSTRFLLGLPVHTLRTLPEDVLILCASNYSGAEFDEISLAIKTVMENSPTVNKTAGELPPTTTGLQIVDWRTKRRET